MIIRVEVEGIGARLDLEGASWTPELLETALRMCGDEVVRVCQSLGIDFDSVVRDDDESESTETE